MQQLHLVGFTTDHRGLILGAQKDTTGNYIVLVDNSLVDQIEELLRLREERSAHRELTAASDVNGTRPLLARPRPESRLTPREVQASLRKGHTLREVAAAAGVPEEWVARFAAPVLAEQAQVLQRTHHFTYTKPRLGPSTQTLAESVAWNLADRGVVLSGDEFDDAWSAFRQGDGLWVVRVSYLSRKRSQHADWIADLSEGTLTAVNRVASELGYVEPGRPRPPGLRPLRPAVTAPPVRPMPAPTSSRSVAAAAMAAAAARSAAAADAARAVPPSASSRPGSYGMPPRSSPPSAPPRSPGAAVTRRSGEVEGTSSKPPRPLVAPTRQPTDDPEGRPAKRGASGRKVAGASKPSREGLAKRPLRPPSGTGGVPPSAGATERKASVDKSLRPSTPTRGSTNGGSRPLFARSSRDTPPPASAGRDADPSARRSDPPPASSGRPAARAAGGPTTQPRRPAADRVRDESGPSTSGERARVASGPSPSSATPVASTPSSGATDRPRPSAARSMSTADRFGPLASRVGPAPSPRPAARDSDPPRGTAGSAAREPDPPRRTAGPGTPATGRAEPPVRAPRAAAADDPAAPVARPVVSTPRPTPQAARPASPRPARAGRPVAAPGRPRRQRPLVAPGREPSAANPAATPVEAPRSAAAPDARRPAPAVERSGRDRRPASEPDTAPVPVVVAPPSWPSPDAGSGEEGIVLIKAGQAGLKDDLPRDPYEEQWRDVGPRAPGEAPREDVGRRSRLRLRRRDSSR